MNALPARKLPVAVVFLVALLMVASSKATAQPPQPVIGYLGFLDCAQTTDPSDLPFVGDIARGADQLGAAYGVFVFYTDGTHRAWGNYLYQGEVNEGWKLGPRLDRPLFIYRPDPPSLPTEIDITSPGKTVAYVRVAIVLFDNDQRFELSRSFETGGLAGHITWILRRGYWIGGWTPLMEELHSDKRQTIFSDKVFVAARDDDTADKIGYNEYKFTAAELENPELFTQISSAAEVYEMRTGRPGRVGGVAYEFTNTGNGSLYLGSLWLVKGPQTEMEQLLSWAGPDIVFQRFTRWVYVMLTNQKDEPVVFSLRPTGPVKREEVTTFVDGVERTRLDPVTLLPLYTAGYWTLDDEVLAPGQSRVYALESPEDELFFYFDAPAKPPEGQFAVLDPQPAQRLRHGQHYYIIDANDPQWQSYGSVTGNVWRWGEIPRELLPYQVWRELQGL
ncbi:MAG: hypothetical protein A2V98_15790 [Planctomycetes bacterium RBG_16_64_12]|nr:MAG: hypothetical protein A2V98_15790 [Planctomycetes bacterium RBG_16_64_12]